jgi:hypothetical protein
MQLNRKKFREITIKVSGYNIFKDKVDPLEQRANLKASLENCTENNKLALLVEGMDCDCGQFSRTYHEKAFSVMEYLKFKKKAFEGVDGTVSIRYGKPSDYPIEGDLKMIA